MTGPHTAQPASLDITEVAQTSGIPTSTIRYYEEVGLITSTGRRGLKRLFAPMYWSASPSSPWANKLALHWPNSGR